MTQKIIYGESPRGVMVKVIDDGIVVSVFILQSKYYIHFLANTLEKGMNPLILPAMGYIYIYYGLYIYIYII